ncbi:MAG TPA: hypothetical protein VES68_01975 [Candidatus Sulfotelmatobacter sp.]|nr:hypothetical protein [Candidatus Sulfotelmatobacter sp.]
MDFQIFDESSLKIKIKKTTLALDPKPKTPKFDADAILVLDKDSDVSRINNPRVIINEVGEYEVSGLKISGFKSNEDVMYGLSIDTTNALVVKASSLGKVSADKLGDYKVAVINVDSDLDQTKVTAIEPSLIILYGEKAKDGAKALGKEDLVKTSKISVSEEKLPEELEIMLLG